MKYSKAALSKMLTMDALVEMLAAYSRAELGRHLPKVRIEDVLNTLSQYCTQEGTRAKPKIYDDTLLRMVQWEEGEVGHRFETWALQEIIGMSEYQKRICIKCGKTFWGTLCPKCFFEKPEPEKKERI